MQLVHSNDTSQSDGHLKWLIIATSNIPQTHPKFGSTDNDIENTTILKAVHSKGNPRIVAEAYCDDKLYVLI